MTEKGSWATADPGFGVRLGVIPFHRSYWVVPGRLLAGFYPASSVPAETTAKLGALLAAGVRHVVNLTEAGEGSRGSPLVDYAPEMLALAGREDLRVTHERHPIRDLNVPTVAGMTATLDAIDVAHRERRPVYVHCWGGRGRTATVIGCWLARHEMAVGDAALSMIRYLRRTDGKADAEAPETVEQKAYVRSWPVGR